jgi:hypothetical protein
MLPLLLQSICATGFRILDIRYMDKRTLTLPFGVHISFLCEELIRSCYFGDVRIDVAIFPIQVSMT